METRAVILDTNVFVAAGFNPQSASAQILKRVRSGQVRMIWCEETRGETQHILNKIRPLSWSYVAELFRESDSYQGELASARFSYIEDPDDRKYAALAEAAGAILITNDDHLLSCRDSAHLEILTPREYWQRIQD